MSHEDLNGQLGRGAINDNTATAIWKSVLSCYLKVMRVERYELDTELAQRREGVGDRLHHEPLKSELDLDGYINFRLKYLTGKLNARMNCLVTRSVKYTCIYSENHLSPFGSI